MTETDFAITPLTCQVFELRQYTLHPGGRDVLIELFDREFLESQDAVGATVIGQFRDHGNPNRFVWLRGFDDMAARQTALTDFYGGPVWAANRDAANATMTDSDNVLMLRPATAEPGVVLRYGQRPATDATELPGSLTTATIHYFDGPVPQEFIDFFENEVTPLLRSTGSSVFGGLVTEPAENNFPALPVRNEHVYVSLSGFEGEEGLAAHEKQLAASERWPAFSARLRSMMSAEPELLRLAPTTRSWLR